MKKLIRFLLSALAVLTVVHNASAAKPELRNIVLFFADDWRHDTLGAAGHLVVKTPNLDTLAEEGIRFTENCVTTSICAVSRASLFSGQWMSRHGATDFKALRKPWKDSFPEVLRDNGYYTGLVGKWHNGAFPPENFDFGRAYNGEHWMKSKSGKLIHVTKQNENDALEFLKERPSEKPFFLMVSFFATHAVDHHPLQYLPQPESYELYTDVEIPIPVTATKEAMEKLPPFLKSEKNEGRNRWGWRFDTPGKYQEMMKNYYRLASEVDATCGKVIAELKRQGIYENTLVIFTTDNGYYHGEHGLGDKWYPHQESIRVPLIIRDPRMAADKRGVTNDEFTLNVDLAPTILGFAGQVAPGEMQGRDMSPLYLAGTKPEWRQEFFYEHPTIRDKEFIPSSQALVRKDWKYFYYPEYDFEQLFHIAQDPFEQNDLAKDPASAAKLEEMRTRFNELKSAAK